MFSLCLCVSAVNLSCGSKPTDMRTLVPAETLVYLETNDLAAALQPIVDSKAFIEVAKSKPDFSALKGVQLAVAVTGFETSEEKLTDEQSVGRVQPRFVAVADTHAWDFQAAGFAEQKLGSFVAGIYDSEPTLQKSDKNGGKYFTWTAKDGRKAFALVTGSLIYFGNDETAIEKCLTVKRGETDSILKTGKIPVSDPATLASGFVSTDGVAQIANIAGLKFASEVVEDSQVQSAVAGLLPQLLRSSITEISWSETNTEHGIEDNYLILMTPEVANIFSETMAPAENPDMSILSQISINAPTVTIYSFKNGEAAFGSLVQVTKRKFQNSAALDLFAGLMFEPYGILRPEKFLVAAGHTLGTVKCDEESGPVTLFTYSNFEDIRPSIVPLKLGVIGTEGGYTELNSADGELQAIDSSGRPVVLGDKKCVNEVYRGNLHPVDRAHSLASRVLSILAPITSFGKDEQIAETIAEVLSESKGRSTSRYQTETRFTKSGMERRTVSDFGLIGSIIAQLGGD